MVWMRFTMINILSIYLHFFQSKRTWWLLVLLSWVMSTLSQNETAIRFDIQPSNTLNLFITSTSKQFLYCNMFPFYGFHITQWMHLAAQKEKFVNLTNIQTKLKSENILHNMFSKSELSLMMNSNGVCVYKTVSLLSRITNIFHCQEYDSRFIILARWTMIWSMTLNIFHAIRKC